jgi:hypothetical protein
VDRDGVLAWLFTEDARYLVSPYADPLVGHEAIRTVLVRRALDRRGGDRLRP